MLMISPEKSHIRDVSPVKAEELKAQGYTRYFENKTSKVHKQVEKTTTKTTTRKKAAKKK